MHILVHESQQIVRMGLLGVPSDNTVTSISSPLLRPRLEGQRTALRGDAYNAKLADYAQVTFTVRLPTGDLLNNFQAILTVFQSPLLGQNPEAQYPSFGTNVSAVLPIDGRISVDVALLGVNRVELQLTRMVNPPGGTPKSLFVLTQITAEERAIDTEYLARMRDRGEV